MNDLISIIVNVSDSEAYINVCLESILRQTYKNYEVLIIPDGHNENTIKICEYYVKKDERFKILYMKENDNPKNFGIKKANAKYITFVNGGDRLLNSYLQDLYNIMKIEKPDLVIADYYFEKDRPSNSKKYILLEKGEVIGEYMRMNVRSNSFAKLYKKTLFNDIKFPVSKKYDDFMTMYKVFDKANKVAVTNMKKYCVIDQKNLNYTDKDYMAKMSVCFDMLNFIESRYQNNIRDCKIKICCEAYDLFKKVNDPIYKRQLFEYIKLYRKYVLNERRVSMDLRVNLMRTILGYNATKYTVAIEKIGRE